MPRQLARCRLSATAQPLWIFWRRFEALMSASVKTNASFSRQISQKKQNPGTNSEISITAGWAVAGETRRQTVSRSLPPSQRDIDSTETNIWACWAPRCRHFRHHFMGWCSLMHLRLFAAAVSRLAGLWSYTSSFDILNARMTNSGTRWWWL